MSKQEEWDSVYRNVPLEEIPWYSSKPEKELVALLERDEINKGKALDLCCGRGVNAIFLANNSFEVSAIDISPTAIKIAKEFAKYDKAEIDFRVANFLNLPFSENEFDFVFDRGCFHHIFKADKPTFIRGILCVLKSKGKMLLLCFSDKNPLWEKNLSKDDIIGYFSNNFEMKFIRDIVHAEPNGDKRYLYSVFMTKKQKEKL